MSSTVNISEEGQRQLIAIGLRVAEYRRKHGLSLKRLSAMSGVTIAALHRLETGQNISLWTWIRVSRVMKNTHTEKPYKTQR